jgi:hypothetical protein
MSRAAKKAWKRIGPMSQERKDAISGALLFSAREKKRAAEADTKRTSNFGVDPELNVSDTKLPLVPVGE